VKVQVTNRLAGGRAVVGNQVKIGRPNGFENFRRDLLGDFESLANNFVGGA